MSHFGDRLSALVDGELGHDERDRLHIHLAACAECRAEAAALRALKRRVAALGDAAMDPGLLRRLFALAEPGGPVRARIPPFPGSRGARPAWRMYPDPARASCPSATLARSARSPRKRRLRYVTVSVAAFIVVAIGGVSFFAGGTQGPPEPRITPPVEMFTVEHSVTTGEVPLVNPTATFLPSGTANRGGP